MARGKKRESLTMEEKLEAALVPEDEQPYELPKNWCWVRLGNLIELHRGVSYKKGDVHSEKQKGDCLILRGGNVGEGYIELDSDNVYVPKHLVSDNQLIRENDIVIVGSTGSSKVIGRSGIARESHMDVAFGAFLIVARPISSFDVHFVDYIFQSHLYRNRIRTLASGVNINNIKAEYITETSIPLPPLAEQHRIVERMESLFSQLDEARDKAQEALDGFEIQKAMILNKAFTGSLTNKWREKKGISDDTWQHTTLGKIASFHQGIQVPVEQQYDDYTEDRIRFIRIVDYTQGNEEPRFIEKSIASDASIVSGDEIVMVRYGASAGFVGDGIKGAIANNMFTITLNEAENQPYVKCFLKSPQMYKILNTSGGSSAMPALNFKTLLAVNIQLPSVDEQKEICRVIDKMLLEYDTTQTIYREVISQIELTKKSILAKAFRGELGTNNPEDESAVELLKSIVDNAKEAE